MSKNLIGLFFSSVLLIQFIFSTSVYAGKTFENHFAEIENPHHTQALVEQALQFLLRRIQVLHVDGANEDGSPRLVTEHFFEKIEYQVKAKDPGAKVYVAGGVVRSLLGYIYKKLYNGHHKVPVERTEQILTRLIRGESRKGAPKDEVLSLSTLGVGSDLDILIDPSVKSAESEKSMKEVTDFINSAETASHLRDVKSKFKYAIVPIGDVKYYHDQIDQTVSQGGSSLDWLAMPITPASGTQIRLPTMHPEIFQKFLAGEYDYFPPTDPSKVRDPDKQTIRGLRALLEIPYLHLSPQGKEQMKKELQVLIDKVKRGEKLSPAAYEQIEKMIRNARFEGAHNRFYSFLSPAEGTEAEDREVEALVYQLSQLSQRGDRNLPLIPEFILNRNPLHRKTPVGTVDSCELKKLGLLMETREFIEKHTDSGRLYHGTPSLDNILSIIRNGFVVSSAQQGSAAVGRGTYSTKDRITAQGYGTPIEFTLADSFLTGAVEPRILDWEMIKDYPEIKALEIKAQELGIDPFQFLAEKCDVDFIVNQYVLIQNSGALKLPKSIKDMIRIYGSRIPSRDELVNPRMSIELIKFLFSNLNEYEPLHSLGILLRMKDLPGSLIPEEALQILMKNPNPTVQVHSLVWYIEDKILKGQFSYQTFFNENPHYLSLFMQVFDRSTDADTLEKALYGLYSLQGQEGIQGLFKEFPDLLGKLIDLAQYDESPKHQRIALTFISPRMNSSISPALSDPAFRELVVNKLITLANGEDPECRTWAIETLKGVPNLEPKGIAQIIRSLDDPDKKVQIGAIKACVVVPYTDPIQHQAAFHKLLEKIGNSDSKIAESAMWAIVADGQRFIQPEGITPLVNSLDLQLAIRRRLSDSCEEVKIAAYEALFRLSPIHPDIIEDLIPWLISQISDPSLHDQYVRSSALFKFIKFAPSDPRVPAAVTDFMDSSMDIGRLPDLNWDSLPALKEALIPKMIEKLMNDRVLNPYSVPIVLENLLALGPSDPRVIAAVTDPADTSFDILQLPLLDWDTVPALKEAFIHKLTTRFENPDPTFRLNAIKLIQRSKVQNDPRIRSILKVFRMDSDPNVLQWAVFMYPYTIEDILAEMKTATLFQKAILANELYRIYQYSATDTISPEDALMLCDGLEHPSPETRGIFAQILEKWLGYNYYKKPLSEVFVKLAHLNRGGDLELQKFIAKVWEKYLPDMRPIPEEVKKEILFSQDHPDAEILNIIQNVIVKWPLDELRGEPKALRSDLISAIHQVFLHGKIETPPFLAATLYQVNALDPAFEKSFSDQWLKQMEVFLRAHQADPADQKVIKELLRLGDYSYPSHGDWKELTPQITEFALKIINDPSSSKDLRSRASVFLLRRMEFTKPSWQYKDFGSHEAATLLHGYYTSCDRPINEVMNPAQIEAIMKLFQ